MQLPNDPLRMAEDDQLRSCHIRELVQSVPIDAPSDHVAIPRTIIQYWHDLGALPPDVRECLYSWEPLKRYGFKRILIDDNGARSFISRRFGTRYLEAFDRCHHPAMRCDYFRLCYIYKHGGFYVDADEVYQGGDCQPFYRDNRLKIQPLCYDTRAVRWFTRTFLLRRRLTPPNGYSMSTTIHSWRRRSTRLFVWH